MIAFLLFPFCFSVLALTFTLIFFLFLQTEMHFLMTRATRWVPMVCVVSELVRKDINLDYVFFL